MIFLNGKVVKNCADISYALHGRVGGEGGGRLHTLKNQPRKFFLLYKTFPCSDDKAFKFGLFADATE